MLVRKSEGAIGLMSLNRMDDRVVLRSMAIDSPMVGHIWGDPRRAVELFDQL